MKRAALLLILPLALAGAGCGPSNQSAQNGASAPQQASNASQAKTYSLSDVAAHAKATDCWMAIDGKIYDVTSYVPQHPGGDKILQGCGQDATQMFDSVRKHQGTATALLPDYEIGTLK